MAPLGREKGKPSPSQMFINKCYIFFLYKAAGHFIKNGEQFTKKKRNLKEVYGSNIESKASLEHQGALTLSLA